MNEAAVKAKLAELEQGRIRHAMAFNAQANINNGLTSRLEEVEQEAHGQSIIMDALMTMLTDEQMETLTELAGQRGLELKRADEEREGEEDSNEPE